MQQSCSKHNRGIKVFLGDVLWVRTLLVRRHPLTLLERRITVLAHKGFFGRVCQLVPIELIDVVARVAASFVPALEAFFRARVLAIDVPLPAPVEYARAGLASKRAQDVLFALDELDILSSMWSATLVGNDRYHEDGKYARVSTRLVFVACAAVDDFFHVAVSAGFSFHASYIVCFITFATYAFAPHDTVFTCRIVRSYATLMACLKPGDDAVLDVKNNLGTLRAQPHSGLVIVNEIRSMFDERFVRLKSIVRANVLRVKLMVFIFFLQRASVLDDVFAEFNSELSACGGARILSNNGRWTKDEAQRQRVGSTLVLKTIKNKISELNIYAGLRHGKDGSVCTELMHGVNTPQCLHAKHNV